MKQAASGQSGACRKNITWSRVHSQYLRAAEFTFTCHLFATARKQHSCSDIFSNLCTERTPALTGEITIAFISNNNLRIAALDISAISNSNWIRIGWLSSRISSCLHAYANYAKPVVIGVLQITCRPQCSPGRCFSCEP